jgi:hypothetical protein
MNNSKYKIIDDYLKNSAHSLDDGFADRVIDRIGHTEKNNPKKQNVLTSFPVLVSAVACLLFLFVFTEWQDYTHQSELSAESTFLENPEKQMIEDLMLFPEKLTGTDSFLTEETYDLLILLDS